MHGHSMGSAVAIAGLVVGLLALLFQILSYRRGK